MRQNNDDQMCVVWEKSTRKICGETAVKSVKVSTELMTVMAPLCAKHLSAHNERAARLRVEPHTTRLKGEVNGIRSRQNVC